MVTIMIKLLLINILLLKELRLLESTEAVILMLQSSDKSSKQAVLVAQIFCSKNKMKKELDGMKLSRIKKEILNLSINT